MASVLALMHEFRSRAIVTALRFPLSAGVGRADGDLEHLLLWVWFHQARQVAFSTHQMMAAALRVIHFDPAELAGHAGNLIIRTSTIGRLPTVYSKHSIHVSHPQKGKFDV